MSKQRARKHSVFVRTARICLPIVVIGIFAIYVVTATPRTVDRNFLRQFQNLDLASDELRMERPQFFGEDTEGVPYEVNAGAAIQDPENPKFISLLDPEAFKALGTADEALVKAKTGLYSVENQTLDLNTEVEFNQGIGNSHIKLSMDAAEVKLDQRIIESDVAVFGENENGSISADGMTAYQDEGRTVFHNARMVIKPKQSSDKVGLRDVPAVDETEKKDN